MIHLFRRLAKFRARRRARKRALVLAEDLGRRLRPTEPILGVALCADENTRYVVRVYCGDAYKDTATMRPPWAECIIVAIAKDSEVAKLIEDAEEAQPYKPIIR
ncbi:MAG: hypothetical protein FWF41_02925 [Betaproteobacteria bacterium]|nr:hypothetical protein [Betaproteobacteria bacterium]